MNKSRWRQTVTALPTLLLLASCASDVARDAKQDAAQVSLTVTVMSFNVQNLFDNVDDPGKDDKAYLPIEAKQSDEHIKACNEIEVASWRDECLNLDWSLAAIEHKLDALADTIRQVNGGLGADIIALQEVENAAILEQLRSGHLAALGYIAPILIEGTDLRGIDVAFLSRFPLVGPAILHSLSIPEFADREKDTRGVLQADFQLPDGSILTGFSVHFPAPFHPTEMRIAAYEHLNGLLQELPSTRFAFAAGDFNTSSREDRDKGLLDRYARPHWTVAHDVGCGHCKGTHYYARDDNWSFLDMILLAKASGKNTTARIRAESVEIANQNPAQVSENGTPERFRSAQSTGVSDHWPLVASFELNKNNSL